MKMDLTDLVVNALIELSRIGIRKINDKDIVIYKEVISKKLKEKNIDVTFDLGKNQYHEFLKETGAYIVVHEDNNILEYVMLPHVVSEDLLHFRGSIPLTFLLTLVDQEVLKALYISVKNNIYNDYYENELIENSLNYSLNKIEGYEKKITEESRKIDNIKNNYQMNKHIKEKQFILNNR